MKIKGNLIDLHSRSTYPAEISIKDGVIASITKIDEVQDWYILPGFVDAHIHIESSMLIPSVFAPMALRHGTVATVSDPHEIANVLGVAGVDFMIDNARDTLLKFNFGAPSCVPPTAFETSGAVVDSDDIKALLARDEIKYLAEMMNYPGVLFKDEEVMLKLKYAKEAGKPIDGHAPGLMGDQAIDYINTGISTDHECFTYKEAKHKIDHGMKILIREGSAAKNYEALAPLFNYKPEFLMFCSDDKHPDDLIVGHINELVKRAVRDGYDLYDVLRAACIHPVEHYGLDVGLIKVGDPADFIVVNDLEDFKIRAVYVDGQDGLAESESKLVEPINNFSTSIKSNAQFALHASSNEVRVIEALDGEIITKEFKANIKIIDGYAQTDTDQDVLKLTVVNRYQDVEPATALIHGFGLKSGAIASCVAHDTHNIIAVGVDDESITRAVNLIIENKGGISAVGTDHELVLPLPFAGIMSGDNGNIIGNQYAKLDAYTKEVLGSSLGAPFMTLSFMALLVIPDLKLSDKGLFSGREFSFVDIEIGK